jgi:DNA-directed RNA polymerase subunit RPC12/RpoP
MSVLVNAIESIQIGVEDYRSADTRRQLSAVRNVVAGLLLLYKEKLRLLSPKHDLDLLIKRDVLPEIDIVGNVSFVGSGKKTVDVQQIKDRFKKLGVDVDWKLFDVINEIRNEVEHYYTSRSRDVVREALSKSFVLIRDFIVVELEKSPLELLGEECWNSLLEVADVYKKEEEECRATFEMVDWKYDTLNECIREIRCSECGSSLIRTNHTGLYTPSMDFQCTSCGNEFSAEDAIEACVTEHLEADAYIAVKDGGDPPYGTCPTCQRETYVLSEDICLACESSRNYVKCSLCGTSLSLDEQELDGFCGYCSHRMEKLRDE